MKHSNRELCPSHSHEKNPKIAKLYTTTGPARKMSTNLEGTPNEIFLPTTLWGKRIVTNNED